MKPKQQTDEGGQDLFRSRLDNIINPRHELVRLAAAIDWHRFDEAFAPLFCDVGNPALATRLMVGVQILKYMYGLSDPQVHECWVENPYYQHFCGEIYFQHEAPFDRSSMTRWRQRLGEEKLIELIKESLATAERTGALATKDVRRVTVDTTVQPKNVAFPTDARQPALHGQPSRRVPETCTGGDIQISLNAALSGHELTGRRALSIEEMP